MCPTVASTTEGNLHDPTFRRALGGIIEQSFLIEAKEDFLNYILGFIAVIQNTKGYGEYQPRVPVEKQVQSVRILGLEASHECFITGEGGWANFNGLRYWD
jgi:hypothetical protein